PDLKKIYPKLAAKRVSVRLNPDTVQRANEALENGSSILVKGATIIHKQGWTTAMSVHPSEFYTNNPFLIGSHFISTSLNRSVSVIGFDARATPEFFWQFASINLSRS